MSIVLGYDSSPAANAALEVAIDLAKRLDEKLVLVYGAGVPGGVSEEMSSHRAALEEIGHRALDEGVARAREAGAEATVELLPRKPVKALLEAAENHDAGFIVVGATSESPMRAAMLGAVPHKLLRRSTRPVLCVPAPS
ncbi:universal stress protein [Kineosporia rhizophila]|uniref:universal stress protein n=1 Tax=Kineosporia TaxID=49184 RepID=UPI001E411D8B|nr:MULTISPECIES: universal stress protein [Kineosporia]MCE0536353.1 universal stress protein [Kineosporia rhizophila]GLY19828.1 hypothetical protein Kisp01_68420 [Kineosporia sp. NBRC 101677]